jgi:hypothetical protein
MKKYSVSVRGKRETWVFYIYGNDEDVKSWRSDGLIIDEIVNTIPYWVAQNGLAKPWIFVQDVLKAIGLYS